MKTTKTYGNIGLTNTRIKRRFRMKENLQKLGIVEL